MYEWAERSLRDLIGSPISGSRPSGGAREDTEGVPSLGGENVLAEGGMTYRVLKRIPHQFYSVMGKGKLMDGDVLINKDGAQTGKVGFYGGEFHQAAVNEHLFILRSSDRVIDQRFLYYCLLRRHTQEAIGRQITGSAQPGLNSTFVDHVRIALPTESLEQRCVAQVLLTLDTAIHETEAIIAKLKAVKQGLLHDLLTRGIDANGELRPPQAEAPHLYKPSPLGWIPKEWELSTVGAEFEIQLGKMLDSQKNAGVLKPYIGNKAVQWDRIDLSEVQQVRLSKSDLLRFRLQHGDLLVCEGGEVGRAAIWEDEFGECYYQKALHRLRPLRRYRPRLMLESLRYQMSKDALSEYISKTSIAHLTQEKLAAVPLPTPANDEQDRIVAEIVAAKHREEAEHAQLQKFRLLKAGLMDDLLTGRVRVTPLLEAAAP